MEYKIICQKCLPNFHEQFSINISPTNDGIYNVTCPKGHNFKINIISHHFQILFENGIYALKDNYYLETLASFTACYERFLEYFIKIVLLSKKTNHKEFSDTWKLVSQQSERQIGAFIFTYLNEFGSKPVLLSQNNTKLRNDVIHKGYFPTKEECINYGNNVIEFIRPILKLLKENIIYESELYDSINYSAGIQSNEVRFYLYPFEIFPIDRLFDESDKRVVQDFLNEII